MGAGSKALSAEREIQRAEWKEVKSLKEKGKSKNGKTVLSVKRGEQGARRKDRQLGWCLVIFWIVFLGSFRRSLWLSAWV